MYPSNLALRILPPTLVVFVSSVHHLRQFSMHKCLAPQDAALPHLLVVGEIGNARGLQGACLKGLPSVVGNAHRSGSLFGVVQACPTRSLPAPYVLGDQSTMLQIATSPSSTMARPLRAASDAIDVYSPAKAESWSALSGNFLDNAQGASTMHYTSAPAVGPLNTALSAVLLQRAALALTPLKAGMWCRLLSESGLLSRYPTLPSSILHGFDISVRPLSCTFAPPNGPSVEEFANAFTLITAAELDTGRWLGPFSRCAIQDAIGPFQTSPISIIPKSKPGASRIIQNLSYPHNAIPPNISSINSSIDSSTFPCTWGTFFSFALMVSSLPPNSEGGCRDIKEAFRTIPLHPSQWPGVVVRLNNDDSFAINTSVVFGVRSGPGAYGSVADAAADLMRWRGLGPLSKWVDDHAFLRILKIYLEEYNVRRAKVRAHISTRQHRGGRIWWEGAPLPDGRIPEYCEDFLFPVIDHSASSPRSDKDARFTYALCDIDSIADDLGYVWELSKDVPFASTVPFTGLLWNLAQKTVALPDEKRAKYISALNMWQTSRVHDLREAQSLYGKLLHVCLVLPPGRAYLTGLETFMALFAGNPFKLRTPPKSSILEINWWSDTLSSAALIRTVPGPIELADPHAFSDASSGVGIGIVIAGRWRAWRLLPGWKAEGRDIGWAEAAGFELLIRVVADLGAFPGDVKLYGDNRGVVEGWWVGRSRNPPTNKIFRRLHAFLGEHRGTAHSRYIPSGENPADAPSRGVYGPHSLLLPRIPIPSELSPYISDFDANFTHAEKISHRTDPPSRPWIKSIDTRERTRRAERSTDIEATSSHVAVVAADW